MDKKKKNSSNPPLTEINPPEADYEVDEEYEDEYDAEEAEPETLVSLENVSVTYSNGVRALDRVSLEIKDRQFTYIVGQSGAGKSTLIKLLIKEISPDSGEIFVNGFDLNSLKHKEIPELRRTIGFVFQDFKLINTMTVYENVAFVLRCTDASAKTIRRRVPHVIGVVGLSEKINSYPTELSGGEQQRVALARALVNNPQLIIADEPTGNLDPKTSIEIMMLLKKLNERGTTVLVVTHEHELVKRFGGRLVAITGGKITYDDMI